MNSKTVRNLVAAAIMFLAATVAHAKDMQIKKTHHVGDRIQFCERGRHHDGLAVYVDGDLKLADWLHNDAKDAGSISNVTYRTFDDGATAVIAFTFGRHSDLLYTICVRGGEVFSSKGNYWKHPHHDVKPDIQSSTVVRFEGGESVFRFAEFRDNKWHKK